MNKSYKEFNDKGFEIYAISLDTHEKGWRKAMDEKNVSWINVVDYDAFNGSAALSYGVKGIPASFLIDKSGTIIASGNEIRGLNLHTKLEELFDK